MARRSGVVPADVVPTDLERLIDLCCAAAGRRAPQIRVERGSRFSNYRRFLQKATPANIGGLAVAHAHALEAIGQLAADLERIGCRCGEAARGDGVHVDICPVTLRQHPTFQVFDHTASDASAPTTETPTAATPSPAPAATTE